LILLLEFSTQSEYDWVVGVWTTDTGYWLFAPRKSIIKTQSCNEWKYCIKCPRTHALRTETVRDDPCTSYLESRRALPTTHDFDDFDSYFSSHIHPLPPRSTYFSPTNSVLSVSQSLEHFLACHQNAFDFFGSVPKKIMLDNLKSAVLKRILGRPPVFNPRYLDFANPYGFTIAACNVGRGNEKGRVENAVGYVKKNFLAGLQIPDFAALGPAARNWLETVANVRLHGETRQKPVELFRAERPCLLPLPANSFDIATVSQQRASP
jgi:hypothetical protein